MPDTPELSFDPWLTASGPESSYERDRPRWRRKAKAGPGAPRVDPDLELIAQPQFELQLTWLGHASFLVQLANQNLLIDPVLSHKRIGLRKRHVAPGLETHQLPEIHALLITHEHADHLDEWTINRLSRDMKVIVPKGLLGYFRERDFTDTVELDWWQSVALDDVPPEDRDVCGLTVTLTPARHGPAGGRFFERVHAQCGGFVVEDSHHAIYHAGDTAFFSGFEEIGCRFPALDAALMPVGSYSREEKNGPRHMTPEEAGLAFLNTGARRMVPMHWGTYQLADEPLREGPDRLRSWWPAAGPGEDRRLVEMAVGETLGWD